MRVGDINRLRPLRSSICSRAKDSTGAAFQVMWARLRLAR